MDCPTCNQSNPAGVRFCGHCGAHLRLACPSCGFENPAGFRFCGECGSPLETASTEKGPAVSPKSTPASAPVSAPTPAPAPAAYTPPHLAQRIRAEMEALERRAPEEGERRTITALFADIKGSMELIEDLDPEEARGIVDPALTLMMEAVHRYEGYVAQSLGDGIFALFGAPIAHEDHPQRALYAALLMQHEMRRAAEKLRAERGVNLQIRVGVNTGEVVLRSIRKDDLHTDYVPVGHSTSLAARLQALASPGNTVVSEETHRLTEGYFEFRPLGPAQVKGTSGPVQIYELAGVGPLRTRLQVAAKRGLARFVGRQREMEVLHRAAEEAAAGSGRIVAVVGDPGVGKSRLAFEFRHSVQSRFLVIETFSVSHGKALPYLPIVDLLRNYFRITPQDDDRAKREKVMGKVLTLDRHLEDVIPFLLHLLNVPDPESDVASMDPKARRNRLFEAIRRLILRESAAQPVLLIFEDLHWLDSESDAFLATLAEGMDTSRLLLLVNYRPEYTHHWGACGCLQEFRLEPLAGVEAQELLDHLLGADPRLGDLRRLILEKTEGNPFFIEEIVQSLLDQNLLRRAETLELTAPVREISLPTTVQGVLQSRIDRLPPEEKAFLQTLAVMGKQFSFGLVRRVVDLPEARLQELLGRLQDAGFLYERAAFPENEYVFKHALTQDVAYRSVLLSRRNLIHEGMAQAIEEIYAGRLEDQYDELAYHYGKTGNTAKAVEYTVRAARSAMRRSAYREADGFLQYALSAIPSLPSREGALAELAVQAVMGAGAMAGKGYASLEAERAYTRMLALAEQLGREDETFDALLGLSVVQTLRGDNAAAMKLAEKMLPLAEGHPDSFRRLSAHMMTGIGLFEQFRLREALAHLEEAWAAFEESTMGTVIERFGQNPGVACLGYIGMVHWMLGNIDRARTLATEAIAMGRHPEHPFSLALAYDFAARIEFELGYVEEAERLLEALESITAAYQFPFWDAQVAQGRGLHLTSLGRGAEAADLLRKGLQAHIAGGSGAWNVEFGFMIARSMLLQGDAPGALRTVREAVQGKTLKPQSEYMHRSILGDILSTIRRDDPEAEASYLRAAGIAREAESNWFLLKVMMRRAELLSGTPRAREAAADLEAVFHTFTEGLATPPLRRAKALLEELSRG